MMVNCLVVFCSLSFFTIFIFCLETLIQHPVPGGAADVKFSILIPMLASELYSSHEQMYPYFIPLATMQGGYVLGDLSSAVSAEHSEWLDVAQVARRWLLGSNCY